VQQLPCSDARVASLPKSCSGACNWPPGALAHVAQLPSTPRRSRQLHSSGWDHFDVPRLRTRWRGKAVHYGCTCTQALQRGSVERVSAGDPPATNCDRVAAYMLEPRKESGSVRACLVRTLKQRPGHTCTPRHCSTQPSCSSLTHVPALHATGCRRRSCRPRGGGDSAARCRARSKNAP
jgi:hypothetical protein